MNNNKNTFYATGRRKTAVARVWLYPEGSGKIVINGRPFSQYFSRERDRVIALMPLKFVDNSNKFDIFARIDGGGTSAQSDALKLGIARALVEYDKNLKPVLRKENLLTRDAREVERKKYGLRGARRRPQYTKR
jgi:small subunit ribosomal protein S9